MTGQVSLTDIQFSENTPLSAKLRNLVQDLQTVERALNALLTEIATAVPIAPSVAPHVLATTTGLQSDHTVSGLTVGQVLKAISATNAAFAKLGLGDLAQTSIVNPVNRQVLQFIDGYWSNVSPTFAGEINDGVNEGTGLAWYLGKSGVSLMFRTLLAGIGVSLTSDDHTITINAAGGGSGGDGYPAALGFAGVL